MSDRWRENKVDLGFNEPNQVHLAPAKNFTRHILSEGLFESVSLGVRKINRNRFDPFSIVKIFVLLVDWGENFTKNFPMGFAILFV